jgi:hypothetical protein
MTTLIYRLSFDENSLEWLAEITTRLLSLDKIVPRSVELIEIIRNTPRGAAAFDLECLGTGRANEQRIVLQPGDTLLRLMTTLRALDGKADCIGKPRPGFSNSR